MSSSNNYPVLNAVEAFAGIGGFGIALERAGVRVDVQIEKDEACLLVLENHFPDAVKIDDIKKAGKHNVPENPFLLVGGFPCFPAGSLVLTECGYLPIEDVKVGMKVLTHKLRWMPVTEIMSKKAPTVILKGRGSNGITTTHEHPFYSRERKISEPVRAGGGRDRIATFTEPKWSPAALMVGKYWASPNTFPEMPIPPIEQRHHESVMPEMGNDFFWFVGAWIGNGWLRQTVRQERATYQTNDQIFVCDSADQIGVIEQKITAAGFHFNKSVERTAVRLVITSKALYRWLYDNFGKMAAGKRLPAWALGMPENYRKALLDGYLFTDGHHSTKTSWQATTVSKALAHGMKLLAQSLGMPSSVWFRKVKPTTVIEGRTVNQHDQWTFACFENTKTQFDIDGFFWGRVKEVKDGEIQKVYNLSVSGDESYVLDGYGVHNCTNLSNAGNRKGLAGSESGLWFEFHRLLREIKPRYVIVENVPGLLSSSGGRDMAVVLAGFTGIVPAVPDGGWRNFGVARRRNDDYYDVTYRVLDSQYAGVPQRRRRVFFMAGLGEFGSRAPQVLLERARLSRHPPTRRSTRQNPATEAGSGAESRDRAGLEADQSQTGAQAPSYAHLPDGRNGAQSRGGSRELTDTDGLTQIPYNIIGVNGNAKERHAYPTETANTLDTWTGVEDKNAGSTVILEMDGQEHQVVSTLLGSGAGVARPAKIESELDFYIPFEYPQAEDAFRMRAFGDYEEDQIASALKSRDYKDATDLISVSQADDEQILAIGTQQVTSWANKSVPREVSPTLSPQESVVAWNPSLSQKKNRNDTKPRFVVRRLTPVETERLQAFPDGWTLMRGIRQQRADEDALGYLRDQYFRATGITLSDREVQTLVADNTRYRQTGNAVTVNVVSWIIERLVALHNGEEVS